MRRSLALLVVVVLVGGLSTVALGAALPPGGTFSDDNGNPHEGNIEAIAAAGVTQGCDVGLYCPSSPVTRGQMASFLARAFAFPTATKDYFPDDNGSTHEANINRIAEAGVTLGYADGTYQPDGPVTRAQMGSFIARAMGLTPIPGDRFADVSGPHEPNINAIASADVTLGCNPEGTLYCPNDLVRRDRMASFIARALGLDPIIPPPTTTTTPLAPGDFSPFEVSGFGDDVVPLSVPNNDMAVVRFVFSGSGNSIAWSLDSSLGVIDLLVNEISAYQGARAVNTKTIFDDLIAYMDIGASAGWEIDVEPLSLARELGTTVSGKTDDVIRTAGGFVAGFNYIGSSNFVVWAYSVDGDADLLVNEIGNYSGNQVVPAFTDYLEIQGQGSWTITR